MEGVENGLGWINARFLRFPSISPSGEKLRVPNVGWNYVKVLEDNHLTQDFMESTRFYFVHSYYADMKDPSQAFMTCNYDGFEYVCAYRKDHIWGVQFHPEKSHAFGMQLLKNFASF
jgi:imidazole glycerol-phosphate synthase subunit HisH